jgi:hypothetical protein
MLRTFKLSFGLDTWAIFGLATVLATFSKIWAIFFNLLVTLAFIQALTSWSVSVDRSG